MQPPESLLAGDIPSFCKVVLTALWRGAEGEPAWTAARPCDLARATRVHIREVKRALAVLKARGAAVREVREVAGRQVLGFALLRGLLPLQRRVGRAPPATGAGTTPRVAKREKSHDATLMEGT